MNTDNLKIEPKWSKSKDEIWNTHFADLENKPVLKARKPNLFIRYAAVAAIAILIILPSVAFLYTKDITARKGEHLVAELPDGSKVTLNADSKISYKPLIWRFNRNVSLKGEAFFEVKPGETFQVKSEDKTVSVLGTSFNIFARGNKYNVTCLTGKVEVSSRLESVVLTPNMQAIEKNDSLIKENIDNVSDFTSWMQNRFIFLAVPLNEVIEEIERQYDIKVSFNTQLDYLYTGIFVKTENPKEILTIIGKPFGIEFKFK